VTEKGVRVTFLGHACFLIEWQGVRVLVDPYRAGDFGGAVALPGLVPAWTHALSTHGHSDHAFLEHLGAALSGIPAEESLGLRRVPLWHDIHGGALRGGVAGTFVLPTPAGDVVHLGDVGEPASSDVTAHFTGPIRLMIVPCGGYFTVGASEAIEWVRVLRPEVAVLCHASDTGVHLTDLSGSREVLPRLTEAERRTITFETIIDLSLSQTPSLKRRTSWVIARPAGHCPAGLPARIGDAESCDLPSLVSDTACCEI
jgi:L-ascorbate metabolism protein UlaG (beta-lactamase superfamily)